MRRNSVLSRERAYRLKQVRAAIARRLGEEYDIATRLPERLSHLVNEIEKIEQSIKARASD
jgi:hypothetical protein